MIVNALEPADARPACGQMSAFGTRVLLVQVKIVAERDRTDGEQTWNERIGNSTV